MHPIPKVLSLNAKPIVGRHPMERSCRWKNSPWQKNLGVCPSIAEWWGKPGHEDTPGSKPERNGIVGLGLEESCREFAWHRGPGLEGSREQQRLTLTKTSLRRKKKVFRRKQYEGILA